MSFVYADFETIVPGGTVAAITGHANEARLALIERGTAISVDVSGIVPAAVSPGDPISLSWLTAMRTAVGTLIAANKLGRISGTFVPWTLSTLLTETHASFTNCGAGSGWISVSQYDPPLASHVREIYYACEVLTFIDASVAATRTKQNVVITARNKGSAGNSIQPRFVGVGAVSDGAKSLALTDTAGAPSVQLATTAAVAAYELFTNEVGAGLVMRLTAKVAGGSGGAAGIGNFDSISGVLDNAEYDETDPLAILIQWNRLGTWTFQNLVDYINGAKRSWEPDGPYSGNTLITASIESGSPSQVLGNSAFTGEGGGP